MKPQQRTPSLLHPFTPQFLNSSIPQFLNFSISQFLNFFIPQFYILHSLLDEITDRAKSNPRLRMNYNLHDSLDAKAQRLFNALEPGTVIPIHRHPETAETYIVVRGKLKVTLFDDDKTVIEETFIHPLTGCFGYHVPKNQWHSVESLESGTVLFEVKDGPYTPLANDDML